ncbi:MAG: hypothetical protein ABIO45_08800 [Burkholderiaceae bacterium]
MGVRRIGLGGALARVAWAGFLSAARGIAESGRVGALANATSGNELNAFVRRCSRSIHGTMTLPNATPREGG